MKRSSQNTSNFAEIFLALLKNFLALAENFLALQKTCQIEAQTYIDFCTCVVGFGSQKYDSHLDRVSTGSGSDLGKL